MPFVLLICVVVSYVCAPPYVYGAHLHPEKYYQELWCSQHHGIMEYVLNDRTRVDCLTDEYAIEFDFAPKWAESIGQALYYAVMTGRRPGVVLIMEQKGDDRYKDRLQRVSDRYGITVWAISSD